LKRNGSAFKRTFIAANRNWTTGPVNWMSPIAVGCKMRRLNAAERTMTARLSKKRMIEGAKRRSHMHVTSSEHDRLICKHMPDNGCWKHSRSERGRLFSWMKSAVKGSKRRTKLDPCKPSKLKRRVLRKSKSALRKRSEQRHGSSWNRSDSAWVESARRKKSADKQHVLRKSKSRLRRLSAES
jgi:hypothetical protein